MKIIDILKMKIKINIYPVGEIIMRATNRNPSLDYGGTWVLWGAGRVPVGVDENDTDFATSEKTGGEKEHQLTVDELAKHRHPAGGSTPAIGKYQYVTSGDGFQLASGSSGRYIIAGMDYVGNNQPHNNIQPYITCYMFKKIA